MKNIIYWVIGLIVLIVSCKENKNCEMIICQNRGTCIKGECHCETGYQGISCEEIDVTKIQELLDNGTETPFTILSKGIPVDNLYGKIYEGGLIFYLHVDNETGMVASPVGQGRIIWGCWGSYDISDTMANGQNIGDGEENSQIIISHCNEVDIAAKICANLILNEKDDWFLPSKQELNLMYTNLHLKGYGNFEDENYWTSTNTDMHRAWRQNFNTGEQMKGAKRNSEEVRAVKSF